MAKECVHQAFQFEQDEKYPPPEHPESAELDRILKNRLDFTFPPPHLQVMSNLQRSQWYGSDGMSKAYDFLSKSSFGNQAIDKDQKKQEMRAQKMIDNKAKKRVGQRNTLAEDEAISRFSPGPSTQKRPRAISSSDVAKEAPPHKRGRSDGATSPSSDEEMKDAVQPLDKGKGKVLVPDSDEDMDKEKYSSDSPPPQSP